MNARGLALISMASMASMASIACMPPPAKVPVETGASEPRVVIEQQNAVPPCELVEPETPTPTYAIQQHDDWLDLWSDRELASPELLASMGFDNESARAALCSMTSENSGGLLYCGDASRQILSITVEHELSILIVEPTERGLRSIELSRWPQVCRCSCGSWAEQQDDFSVVVFEYEDVAIDVHFEDGQVVEGCEEGDECETACMGERYGSQRLLVLDEALGVRASFVDREIREDREFALFFALDDKGRFTAKVDCTQILVVE
ncbi:hypothetical protein ACNOYE_12110 [Nannocystaceae bacterium ST9]